MTTTSDEEHKGGGGGRNSDKNLSGNNTVFQMGKKYTITRLPHTVSVAMREPPV